MNPIIVGVDGSDTARTAAQQAADLAGRCGVPLHLVSAIPKRSTKTVSAGGETWHLDSVSAAEQVVTGLANELRAKAEITTSVGNGNPADVVLAEATRIEASIIVVGNKHVQGAARVLGSVAADIARRAPCAVLIAKTT